MGDQENNPPEIPAKKSKKQYKTYRSPRTETAIRIMATNGGIVSAAMREAGFAEEYARQPQKFVQTRAFQELSKILLPDLTVLERHRGLLDAQNLNNEKFPSGIADQDIRDLLSGVGCTVQAIYLLSPGASEKMVYYWAPNYKAHKDAIELAYKIGGHIKPGTQQTLLPVQININKARDKYESKPNS